MLARIRRADLLYLLAAALFLVTLVVAASGSRTDQTGLSRSASVFDEGPGGTAVLRRWLEALAVATIVVQGDRFAVDAADEKVLFLLGATEPLTPSDVTTLRRFVEDGGSLVVATEAGIAEALLLRPYGIGLAGFTGGTADVVGPAAASAGARTLSADRGREVDLGARGLAVARTARAPLAGLVRDGRGLVYVVGSLAPFLSGQIGEADNGRFALALAGAALRSGGTVAFDEYHHGAHPAPDVMAILERTWPGRALLLAGLLAFAYAALTGRRLGPPLPLVHRPARSSLDHVRAFAGLVRRSGHGEIARERLRGELRAGMARAAGMDPAAPLERVLGALAGIDPARAAEARQVDGLLSRPLREADLLRTVRRIDGIVHPEQRA